MKQPFRRHVFVTLDRWIAISSMTWGIRFALNGDTSMSVVNIGLALVETLLAAIFWTSAETER